MRSVYPSGAARAAASMPMRLPAPGLFSTKNCWPSVLEKCSASTRPTMSVPPAGGDGTMMRTGCEGYVWADACTAAKSIRALTQRMQDLSADIDRLGRHEHERDAAGNRAAVDPIVQRRLLHEHVARAQAHVADVELHVDLAGDHHRVVDGLGAMHARRDTGLIFHHPEDGAVGSRPGDTAFVASPAGDDVAAALVDRHPGFALRIVVGDHASNFQCHKSFRVMRMCCRRRAAG